MGRLRIWLKGYFSPQFDRIESLYKLKIVMRWLATVSTGIVVVREQQNISLAMALQISLETIRPTIL